MDDVTQRRLTVREAAERLGVHENTIRNWAKDGRLTVHRLPGSRFMRFDPEEIERVRDSRHSPSLARSSQRRAFGPELVDATQLSQWADTTEAAYLFPEVVRRLLAATPGVSNISMPSGEGVRAGGWDGQAVSRGASFLPDGNLRFEIGVGKDPRRKAQADYEKRASEPQEGRGDVIFVFATPRRWTSAADWSRKMREKGVFRDVRVLDADDFAGWLAATPAVHVWVSEQLGRSPADARTLDDWWSRFLAAAKIRLAPEFFIAGRYAEAEQVVARLGGRADCTTVLAASRDDVLAFVASALLLAGDGHAKALLDRAIIVSSPAAWERLSRESAPSILIPLFDSPDVAQAISSGHHVVRPFERHAAMGQPLIELPRVHRRVAADALRAASESGQSSADEPAFANDDAVTYEEADRLAALARRSMPAMLRTVARSDTVARPPWIRTPLGPAIAPLALLQSWTDSPADREVVEKLTNRPWPDVSRDLLAAYNSSDPPFVQHRSDHADGRVRWTSSSGEESLILFSPFVDDDCLEAWRDIAERVLLQDHPLSDSEEGHHQRFSTALTEGVANAIALLGSSRDLGVDERRFADAARHVVARLLHRANADVDGGTWASLSPALRALAEGAPEVFIRELETALSGDARVLSDLFPDTADPPLIAGHAPYTGLLWALEMLGTSAEYFQDAVTALTHLARLHPVETRSYGPLSSLACLFVGWIRHTAAPTAARISAIEAMAAETPSVAWDLILRCLPRLHAHAVPPARAKYRDWAPQDRAVPLSEWSHYAAELTRIALGLVGHAPTRWSELLPHLSSLPPRSQGHVMQTLREVTADPTLSPSDRVALWDVVRETVAEHREYSTAEWALPPEIVEQLEECASSVRPITSDQFAHLFDWRPHIPGVERSDFENYDRQIDERRRAAVEGALSLGGDSLVRLTRSVPQPRFLGGTLAALDPDGARTPVLSWLSSTDPQLSGAASGWAWKVLHGQEPPLAELLMRPETNTDRARLLLALNARSTSHTWNQLGAYPDVETEYWQASTPVPENASDTAYAVERLIAARRPQVAVEVLADWIHGAGDEGIELGLIAKVLGEAGREPPSDGGRAIGYEVGQLLDTLERRQWPTRSLAELELSLFRFLRRERRPKALHRLLNDEAEEFVRLVTLAFHGNQDVKATLDDSQSALARQAWYILSDWHEPPGTGNDGKIDVDHLRAWVRAARLGLADAKRVDVGDEILGGILATCSSGEDGAWPDEPVREIIEELGNSRIENGFFSGSVNRRGVFMRDPYEGGTSERALAEQYRTWARAVAGRWRRTARTLQGIADWYERNADGEDDRARLTSDLE